MGYLRCWLRSVQPDGRRDADSNTESAFAELLYSMGRDRNTLSAALVWDLQGRLLTCKYAPALASFGPKFRRSKALDILLSRVKTIGTSMAAIAWVTATPVTATATESGNHGHGVAYNSYEKGANKHHQHELKWGVPGHSSEVTRTVEIIMGDIFFEPVVIEANVGETVRFLLRNDGALVHEFNMGTRHMHLEHQMEMAKMIRLGMMTKTTLNHEKMKHGGMTHEGANSVLLEHGQDAELIWIFTQPGRLDFACNVPGHYEAGMVGLISILEE